jgi:hypothetical protein
MHVAINILLLNNFHVRLRNDSNQEVEKNHNHEEGVDVPREPD